MCSIVGGIEWAWEKAHRDDGTIMVVVEPYQESQGDAVKVVAVVEKQSFWIKAIGPCAKKCAMAALRGQDGWRQIQIADGLH